MIGELDRYNNIEEENLFDEIYSSIHCCVCGNIILNSDFTYVYNGVCGDTCLEKSLKKGN